METTNINIEELEEYSKGFERRESELKTEAREKIIEILSALPGKEFFSANGLGYFSREYSSYPYENGIESVDETIYKISLDENGGISVTGGCYYDENGNLIIGDGSGRDMTFPENGAVIDYPNTLVSLISELKNLFKK